MNATPIYQPLPFEPEDVGSIKARFAAALEPEFSERDMVEAMSGRAPIAAMLRKHVFDFNVGIRMIVSVERLLGNRYLHCSFLVDVSSRVKYSEEALREMALDLAAEFAQVETIKHEVRSKKGLHLWFAYEHKHDSQAISA